MSLPLITGTYVNNYNKMKCMLVIKVFIKFLGTRRIKGLTEKKQEEQRIRGGFLEEETRIES